ncbi:MAG: hypothetical protein LBQ02_01450 [Candidatus Nomurabacteria bacterium]|jgi:hypothetical protein|nr:hypothetical protein [Candidatus Nomurabacteria bacterium]
MPECLWEECPYWKDCRKEGSSFRSTKHHKYWPRSDYDDELGRAFRELPENTELICRYYHDVLHKTTKPPEKPCRRMMLELVENYAR